MVSVGDAVQEDIIEKKSSTESLSREERGVSHLSGDAEANLNEDTMIGFNKNEPSWLSRNHSLVRRLRLFALAALILGWWISATVLHATRHRWIVQTFFAWSFIAIIAFRFIPNSIVTRPVEAVWIPLIQKPFFALPNYVRHGLGWLALLAIVLGSAFGFELENVRQSLFLFFFKDKSHLKPLADPRWP
jgi:CNT family concentrative nucleoside transporter